MSRPGSRRRAAVRRNMAARIACIGECMIELNEDPSGGPGAMRRGFGGDTLNTAVYLARELAGTGMRAHYVTLLGDDPFSAEMLDGWAAEGIETGLVERLPGMLPGLYMIRVDARGERSFHYWRNQAAARRLFAAGHGQATLETLAGFQAIYFSAITLAILGDEGRSRLFDLCDRVRARGGIVAFDSNYRPRLWPDAATARAIVAEAWRRSTLGLPSFDDEAALFGDADARATVTRLRAAGCTEIAVKRGGEPCLLATETGEAEIASQPVARIIDTTAAGDSFNAAYIAARLKGLPPRDAVMAGHVLAATVIGHRGAIVPRG